MSESNFPTTPSFNPGQIPSKAENQASKQQVEIVRLPKDVRERPPEGKIEGKVVRTDPAENRVTIRTARGEIDVQFPKDRALPPRNAPVELRLPPQITQDNASANLRVLPQTPQPTVTATRPPVYQAPAQPAPPVAPAQALPPAQIGQTVQLTPLPPQQIPQIQIPQPVSIVVAQTQPVPAPALQQLVLNASLSAITEGISTDPLNLSTPKLPLEILSQSNGPISLAVRGADQNLILQLLKLPSPLAQINNELENTARFIRPIPVSPAQSALQPNITFSTQGIAPQNATALPSPQTINVFLVPQTTAPQQTSAPTILQNKTFLPTSFSTSATGALEKPLNLNIQNISSPRIQIVPVGETATSPQLIPTQKPPVQNFLSNPSQVLANVIGTTPQNQPVITLFPPGSPSSLTFTLQNTQAMPGSFLSFPAAALPSTGASSAQIPLPQNFTNLTALPSWPALEEMMDVLQNTNPQLAQAISRLIPAAQSPSQMAPSLLFFVAALRAGDISAWLGERPLDLLRRLGKGDLITRLGNDFSSLSRLSSEALPNEWRGMALPFSAQDQLQNIVLYYKHENSEGDEKTSSKQTRFIFDLDLSRMGPVQLDGLFKPARLDLVVRTETDLSDPMKQLMRQNYASALKTTELTGELTFQSNADNFVKIVTPDEKVGLFT